METVKKSLILILIVATLLLSCKSEKKHQAPSFYYWKTEFALSNIEKINLAHLKVKHLYVKMFDVVWDYDENETRPVGILEDNGELSDYSITPVIYLKNEVFKNLDLIGSKKLAKNVVEQVSKMSSKYNFTYNELQLDCDWTALTKDKFFEFLKKIKSLTNLTVSSTIRLHQIKYKKKTGIPPCDKGVLMFYNMGEINTSKSRNSIFNPDDAKKYSSFIKSYPLPLSAALPIYSWGIHSRSGKVKQLLPRREFVDFIDNDNFKIDSPFVRVINPIVYKGIAFEKNDYIKIESINSEACMKAAEILKENAPKEGYLDIIFFDLDEHTINHFNHEKITDIYDLLP